MSALPTHEISFSEDGLVCEIVFRDLFVADRIFSVIKDLKLDGGYAAMRGVIWDLRNADLSELTLGDMRDIFVRQKQTEPTKHLRVACVISSDVDKHILKLWEDIRVDADPNIRRWFANLEDAREWVAS